MIIKNQSCIINQVDTQEQWLADNKCYVSFFAVVIIVAIIIVMTDEKEKL